MSRDAQRILWDVTRAHRSGPETGIRRLSRRLRENIGHTTAGSVAEVHWDAGTRSFADAGGAAPKPGDVLVTTELFSEPERPGIGAWLASRPCAAVAFCHDLLPLRLPESVRPNAVRRAPDHLRLLAAFDAVAAISRDTAQDLARWWEFQQPGRRPAIHMVRPGSDGLGLQRSSLANPPAGRSLLMLGAIEPRKRQAWIAGLAATVTGAPPGSRLVLAGRVNEIHGTGEMRAVRAAAGKSHVRIEHVDTPDDARLHGLLAEARALVFASAGEGAGLPVGEALWAGLPCLHSDLPVLQEWGVEGCAVIPSQSPDSWSAALARAWCDDAWIASLAASARARTLGTWRDSAVELARVIEAAVQSFQENLPASAT
jgi:glycosyltransferase involved in cell wall biosynthesis